MMYSRTRMLAIAALSFLLLLPAAARSAEPRPPAPDFRCSTWLNSPPLTLRQLRGKVVLIDFWEYTCINCIRTFPYLRRWNALYGPLGLVTIGVHTPEFAFGRDPKRVADAARRFGLTFPIAVDSDYKVWNAFNNEAWPAKYLIDKDGRIAFVHIGEGDYAEFERHIQELLAEANPQLKFSDAGFRPPASLPESGCEPPTEETYLGFERGDRIANRGGYVASHPAVYTAPATVPLDGYALSGNWLATAEALTDRAGAALVLHYRAKSVYLVGGPGDGSPGSLTLIQDGKPVPPNARGVDLKTGDRGRTYVELSSRRMYYLIANPNFGEHTLKLVAQTPAVALYAFTFGNNCETAFEHR